MGRNNKQRGRDRSPPPRPTPVQEGPYSASSRAPRSSVLRPAAWAVCRISPRVMFRTSSTVSPRAAATRVACASVSRPLENVPRCKPLFVFGVCTPATAAVGRLGWMLGGAVGGVLGVAAATSTFGGVFTTVEWAGLAVLGPAAFGVLGPLGVFGPFGVRG